MPAIMDARWLVLDTTSLENAGGALRMKLVTGGILERTATGVDVKVGSVTNAHLTGAIAFTKLADNANIARLDLPQTITNAWNFPSGANAPTIAGSSLATTTEVHAISQGLTGKSSVRAMSDVNLPLTGIPTLVDGVNTLIDGDYILLTGNTNAIENGEWVIHAGAWARPPEFATGASAAGKFVFINEGTAYQDKGWVCISDTPNDVVDTNTLAWSPFSGAGAITPGNGIIITGNIINVDPANLKLGGTAEIDGDQLAIDFTPATYVPNTTPTIVNDVKHLTAHLKGIDDGIGAIGQDHKEIFVLTSTDILNKYISLAINPKVPSNVELKVKGAPSLDYGTDYQIDNVVLNRLTWAGLDLDGLLLTGDRLTVSFED